MKLRIGLKSNHMETVNVIASIGSIITAAAAAATVIIAFCAYRLATKNLGFTADRHDRENVSIVFQSIDVDKYPMKVNFILYNRANVDLIIEDAHANIASADHGWTIRFHSFLPGNPNPNEEADFTWSYEGRNMKSYSNSHYDALAVEPSSKMQIQCELLMHEEVDSSLNVGTIKARLCYDKAATKEYELRIPNVPDIRQIMEAQLTLAKSRQ